MNNNVEQYIDESYSSIKKFNDIAGNLENVTPELISNQLSYIFEELTETIDAFESGNDIELLDGSVDVWVTAAGLLQKLESAGYNVQEAMWRVDCNNMSKYPPADNPWYDLLPEGTTAELNAKYNRVVFKDGNGKVRKPRNFVPVYLSGLEVKGFLKGGSND